MGKLTNKQELINGINSLLINTKEYKYNWKIQFQDEYSKSGTPVLTITINAQQKNEKIVNINLNGHLFINQAMTLNIYEQNKIYQIREYLRYHNHYDIEYSEFVDSVFNKEK